MLPTLHNQPDAGVRFAGKFLISRAHAGARRQVLRQWYVERAQEKILPRVRVHARSLGVSYGQAKIGDSHFRWGSCTPGDNLNFDWRLIKAPMFAIDYVIVHELAHLLEANHTPRFWNIVRAQLPAMDRARGWLQENGQSLEEEVQGVTPIDTRHPWHPHWLRADRRATAA